MSRNCFVPYCHEGYKSQLKKNKLNGIIRISMFKAPKDALLLEKWAKAIRRSDRELRPRIDCVCEKHFDETYLDRYFETKMPDSSINRIKRDRILLKKNAIPTIFPDLPQHLTTKKHIKKTIAEQNVYSNNNISNTNEFISETYNNLQDQFKNMVIPNGWFFSSSYCSLLLGYLNSNHELIKKIIISENDLNLKVFIKNNPVIIAHTPVTCIEDIQKILKTVDGYKMCTGTGIDNCTKSDQCLEYANLLSLNQVQRCVECSKRRRKYKIDIQRVTTKNELQNV